MAGTFDAGRVHRKTEAVYQYTTERGEPAFEIIRFYPKDFRVRYKDAAGQMIWKRPAVTYPYRLHQVLLATPQDIVFVCEGEKDADTLARLKVIATSAPFGAKLSSWRKEWLPWFAKKHIVCLPDNDAIGRTYMEQVRELLAPVAYDVVTLILPDLQEKEDVTDWLTKRGGDLQALLSRSWAELKKVEKRSAYGTYSEWAETDRGDSWEGDKAPEAVEQLDEDLGDEIDTTFKPFPLETLPFIVREYVKHAAKALHCEPTFLAVPALCGLAGIIGNTRVIELKESWQEPAVIWGVLIADSSTLKSPSLDSAMGAGYAIQDRLFKEYEQRFLAWKDEMEDWKAAGGKADGSAKYASKPSPQKPTAVRMIVNDITIEKLAEIMHQNPRGLLLLRDELAGWFGSFGRYKASGGGSDLPFWLEIYRAKAITIDRKTGENPTLYIPRFAVSVTGTIQPQIMARCLTPDYFESGLVSRILLAMPPRRKKVWSEETIPHDVGEAYRRLYRDLWESLGKENDGKDGWPKVVPLDPEAKATWIRFYTAWAERQVESEGEKSYAMAKLEAYCARFALIFSVVEWFSGEMTREVVTADHILRGWQLVEWFAAEAERVYKLIGDPEAKVEQERLADFIASIGGEITPRRLLRANPAKYKTSEEATAKLEALVLAKLGDWAYRPATGDKGGRGVKTFVLIDR